MGKSSFNKFILFLSLGLFVAGCQPYVEPVPSGSIVPIFYMTGTMNGNDFSYLADGDHFQSESTQATDSLGVEVYSGTIRSAHCPDGDCLPTMQLNLRGKANIDESIGVEPYAIRHIPDFVPMETSNYTITLRPEALGNPTSCTWTIGGENFVTTGSEPLIIERSSHDTVAIWVNLVAAFAGGCDATISNYVYLPHHGCSATIKSRTLTSSQHKLFEAKTTGKPGFDYQWSFESGVTASSREVEYFFHTTPSDGIEFMILDVVGDNCAASWSRNEVINDSIADCNVNFGYDIETIVVTSEPPVLAEDFHSIELEYIDGNGQKFWSISAEQPSWAKFNVENVQDFIEPLTGTAPHTKKVTANFSLLLKAKNGDEIELKDCQLVLPMGSF
jgi:hypothetical protein